MGKMRLVRPPASGASMSSNVSIPNPSCMVTKTADVTLALTLSRCHYP